MVVLQKVKIVFTFLAFLWYTYLCKILEYEKGDLVIMRKLVVSILFSCFMVFSAVGFASPASDALAREDAVAMPITQTIVGGKKDFSSFEKYIDKTMIKDMSLFSKVAEQNPDITSLQDVRFISYQQNGAVDVITYIGITSNQDAIGFHFMFNSKSKLLIGVAINKYDKVSAETR